MKKILRKAMDTFFVNLAIMELRMHNAQDKDTKLTNNDLMYLSIIETRSGHYTVTKLAEILEISKPSVTNKMNELEKKGYITKQKDEVDKRIQYLCINKEKMKNEYYYQKCEEMDSMITEKITSKYTEEQLSAFINILQDIGDVYLGKIEHKEESK